LTPGLVSVVVASYNHAKFLPQRIESLLNQSYSSLEILIIDDCSSDNSVEVLRAYESDPRVRLLVREQNGGWVTVSNQGVSMAVGEYVIFANCDDACAPTMIECLVGALRQHPSAGIAFCRSLLVDAKDKILGDDFKIREASFRARCSTDALLSGPEMSRFLLHSCVIPNLSAALIRKECFLVAGELSQAYRANSDWDLFFRIAAHYDVAYVAAPLNRFRQHQTTIRSVTKGRVTYEEFFRLLLGQIRLLNLSFLERCRYRTRVMSLWGHHAVTQPLMALQNFPYHLARILKLDPLAILFLAPAVVQFGVISIAKLLTRIGGKQDR
jgi:glycosyltransferase involved in cell wall biosynthesis